MDLSERETRARDRTCLALDVATTDEAMGLVRELSDLVGVFKVGKELHSAACNEGRPIIKEIERAGGKVFLDLKFHDTPQTVYRACRASVVAGIRVLNVHVAGGKEMCRMAVRGAQEKAQSLKIDIPKVVGVTLLTSLDDEDLKEQHIGIDYERLAIRRTRLAKEWGLDGIVCPANRAKILRQIASPPFLFVTPGIEWRGAKGLGQKQLYGPDQAVRDCEESILVVGSAITNSSDRRSTAYEILQAMAPYV